MTPEERLLLTIDQNVNALRAAHYSHEAAPFYEIMSDGIYWSDEIPLSHDQELIGLMRYIFNIRTRCALTEKPIANQVWNCFKYKVPDWPGFRPERCDPRALRQLYEKLYVEAKLPES